MGVFSGHIGGFGGCFEGVLGVFWMFLGGKYGRL